MPSHMYADSVAGGPPSLAARSPERQSTKLAVGQRALLLALAPNPVNSDHRGNSRGKCRRTHSCMPLGERDVNELGMAQAKVREVSARNFPFVVSDRTDAAYRKARADSALQRRCAADANGQHSDRNGRLVSSSHEAHVVEGPHMALTSVNVPQRCMEAGREGRYAGQPSTAGVVFDAHISIGKGTGSPRASLVEGELTSGSVANRCTPLLTPAKKSDRIRGGSRSPEELFACVPDFSGDSPPMYSTRGIAIRGYRDREKCTGPAVAHRAQSCGDQGSRERRLGTLSRLSPSTSLGERSPGKAEWPRTGHSLAVASSFPWHSKSPLSASSSLFREAQRHELLRQMAYIDAELQRAGDVRWANQLRGGTGVGAFAATHAPELIAQRAVCERRLSALVEGNGGCLTRPKGRSASRGTRPSWRDSVTDGIVDITSPPPRSYSRHTCCTPERERVHHSQQQQQQQQCGPSLRTPFDATRKVLGCRLFEKVAERGTSPIRRSLNPQVQATPTTDRRRAAHVDASELFWQPFPNSSAPCTPEALRTTAQLERYLAAEEALRYALPAAAATSTGGTEPVLRSRSCSRRGAHGRASVEMQLSRQVYAPPLAFFAARRQRLLQSMSSVRAYRPHSPTEETTASGSISSRMGDPEVCGNILHSEPLDHLCHTAQKRSPSSGPSNDAIGMGGRSTDASGDVLVDHQRQP